VQYRQSTYQYLTVAQWIITAHVAVECCRRRRGCTARACGDVRLRLLCWLLTTWNHRKEQPLLLRRRDVLVNLLEVPLQPRIASTTARNRTRLGGAPRTYSLPRLASIRRYNTRTPKHMSTPVNSCTDYSHTAKTNWQTAEVSQSHLHSAHSQLKDTETQV